MAMPTDIKVIDCMLGIPEAEDRGDWFTSFRPLIKDQQTLQQFSMPAQYMFKDVPQTGAVDDFVKWTVDQMDRFNIDKAMVGWNDNATSRRANAWSGSSAGSCSNRHSRRSRAPTPTGSQLCTHCRASSSVATAMPLSSASVASGKSR